MISCNTKGRFIFVEPHLEFVLLLSERWDEEIIVSSSLLLPSCSSQFVCRDKTFFDVNDVNGMIRKTVNAS